MFLVTSVLLLLICNPSAVLSLSGHPDLITSLPGVAHMPDTPFYSGYLRVNNQKALHYWYVTSEIPDAENLIIWFNGGPGCSSMEGLFTENGPYKFDIRGRLYPNPYSWHKLAHVLYIEAPAGVGFSRAPPNYTIDDDINAQDTTKALLDFFENKFPALRGTSIYVTGESYAGFYIPILVDYILTMGVDSLGNRIKGLLIGNPLLSHNINSESTVYFSYYHGIFGKTKWDTLIGSCCSSTYDSSKHNCNFYAPTDENCYIELHQTVNAVYNSGLNIYNIYKDCATPESLIPMRYDMEDFRKTYIKALKKNYFGKKKHQLLKSLKSSNLRLTPPCSNTSALSKYLNRADVKHAIHVDDVHWEICSGDVHNNFVKKYDDVSRYLKSILSPEKDITILLYFGDMDVACNHLGGEWFTDSLNIPVTLSRRSWSITKHGTDQIAGYMKIYDKLTYATVKGAGHMVPTDQPHASYVMVEKFLNDEPL